MLKENNSISPGTQQAQSLNNNTDTAGSGTNRIIVSALDKKRYLNGQAVREPFKKDIFALLNHEKGGHSERWINSAIDRGTHYFSGDKLCNSFLQSHKYYYILQEDSENIGRATPSIKKHFNRVKTVFDFGPGNIISLVEKSMPIVKALDNVKYYIPFDFLESNLEDAEKAANHGLPGVKITKIKRDFFNAASLTAPPIISVDGNILALCLGSTIENPEMMVGGDFPESDIINKINLLINQTNQSSPRMQGNGLVFTFDANPDLKSAKKAYQHPDWENSIFGLAIDIQTVLMPTKEFNPFYWEYKLIDDWKNHVLHHCIVPKRDMEFDIDEEHFKVRKGEPYVIINTFKFPLDLFQEMAIKAGAKPLKPIIHPKGRMVEQSLDI